MNAPAQPKLVAIALAAIFLTLAQGCTVGPRYHTPAPPTVSTYTPDPQPVARDAGKADSAQRFATSAAVSAVWWTRFGSPELDVMVNRALRNSPTLTEATARLRQAQQELAARTGTTKYPSVSGTASVEELQPNLSAYGIPFPNPSPFTLLNGSVAVSYALDIFGGNRRMIESLRADRDYQQWQLEGARLMLVGNVVSAAIRLAQLEEQFRVTQQILEIQQQQLAITAQRQGAGGASEFDLHGQRTSVAQVRATLSPLRQQIDATRDQLAALMGDPPSEAHIEDIKLAQLRLPAELPLTLPSTLVRQRPDICAAESLLHQASANVGVATANLYPQITLSGTGGGIGTSFLSGGDLWNVGGSLTQPLFNGGALHAEKRKAIAAYDEADAAYRQTVLDAFRQVADTLYAIQHDREMFESRTVAADNAQASYRIAAARYQDGGISELALLDARLQQLQTSLDRTSASASRLFDSATLFQALGGGWWNQTGISKRP